MKNISVTKKKPFNTLICVLFCKIYADDIVQFERMTSGIYLSEIQFCEVYAFFTILTPNLDMDLNKMSFILKLVVLFCLWIKVFLARRQIQ